MTACRKNNSSYLPRQRGAAFIVMIVILVMGAATILVGSFSKATLQIERNKKTSEALAQAKEALIGYAVTYGDRESGNVHGYLPCPDSGIGTAEGSADGSCGSKDVSRLGRFPWRTLGLPALRDGGGECLWYAVSGTYKNNPKTGLMNWDTKGLLKVSDTRGNTIASDIVAVIFAPGPPLSSQNRTTSSNATVCGGNYTSTSYLDSDPVHGINNTDIATGKFILDHTDRDPIDPNKITAEVNDQFVYITRQDIWNAMLRRSDFMLTLTNMTQQVAGCIASYGTNNANGDNLSLPWAAPLNLSDYTVNGNYNDLSGLDAGRVPFYVNTSKPKTNNKMMGYNLLSQTNCPAGWTDVDPWWNNWKDHLYYAIGHEFAPLSDWWRDTNNCGTCLRVNGHGHYAAVVIFAGQALPMQGRTDKSVLSDYLEGRNFSNYPNSYGDGDYQGGAATSSFNDMLFCIKQDLTVVQYDSAQGRCP